MFCAYSGIVWFLDDSHRRFSQVGRHEDSLSDVAFCQSSTGSSNLVISCSYDGTVFLWDLRAFPSTPIQSLKVPPPANCVAWKDNFVVCGFQESGGLCLWDSRNLAEPLTLEESHAEAVTQLLFMEDGRLMSSGEDGYICSLDTQKLPDEDEVGILRTNYGDVLIG